MTVCCALATFVGCGGGESSRSPEDAAATSAATAPATTATTPEPPRLRVVPLRWRQPTVEPHPGYSVDRVVVRDIKKGTGPAVWPHDYVLMDYIEGNYRTGRVFYDAWDEPGPVAGVILARRERWRGFTIGMRGMRVGGRRQIIVPPRLGGIEGPGHAEYRAYLIFDVALRGIYARGCDDGGGNCRSGP